MCPTINRIEDSIRPLKMVPMCPIIIAIPIKFIKQYLKVLFYKYIYYYNNENIYIKT